MKSYHMNSGAGIEGILLRERGEARPALAGVELPPVPAIPASKELEAARIAIDPVKLIDNGCSLLTRNMFREEWDRYLPGEPYRATCPNLPLEPKAK